MNYRCDPRIISFSNNTSCVTDMIAGKNQHPSRQVISKCDANYFAENVKPNDAVLCRNNGPLFKYGCALWLKGFKPTSPQDAEPGQSFIQKLLADIVQSVNKPQDEEESAKKKITKQMITKQHI